MAKRPEAADAAESHEHEAGFEGSKPYWCGCLKEVVWKGETVVGPRDAYHVAGVTFPYEHAVVPYSATTPPQARPHYGQIQYLTPEQVDQVNKAVETKRVRRMGQRVDLVSINREGFRRHRTDVPLAAFLYMMELPENGVYERPLEYAQPMQTA